MPSSSKPNNARRTFPTIGLNSTVAFFSAIGYMLRRSMQRPVWANALVGHPNGSNGAPALQFVGGRAPWDRKPTMDPITTPRGAPGAKNYRGISILIVEDNPGDAVLIREMLGLTPYASADLHFASSLKEARKGAWDHSSVAMVLLDLGLPESSGMTTLRAIKELYPDSAIIVLTGLNDLAMADQALSEGAQNYLGKDELEAGLLTRTIRASIERHGFIQRLREADKAVMDRERQFHAITEHGADLLTIRDATGAVLYESPVKRRLLGYTKDEVGVPTGFDLIHPEDVAATRALFEASLRAPGVPLEHTGRFIRKDGSIIHVKGHMTNLLHVPEVQGVVSNIHDVTELVLANERTRSSEARLTEAQKLGHIGSWEHRLEGSKDPRKGTGQWSDEMFSILGHEPGAIDPSFMHFMSAVHPDDRELVQQIVWEGIREAKHCSFDHRICRPDGAVRWLHQETSTVHDPTSGRPQRIVGTMQDITERKNADDRLRESEERFRAMIEGSEDGITLSYPEKGVLYSSPSCLRILGYTHEELRMTPVADLVAEEDMEALTVAARSVLATPGHSERVRVKILHKDGRQRSIESLLTNMLHVPAVGALVTNFRDVTGSVALQEQLAFDRSNLSAIINSTQDLVWSVDKELRLITANEAFLSTIEHLVGIRLKPGDSLMISDVSGASPTEHWRGHYQRAFAGESFTVEENIIDPIESHTTINLGPLRDGEAIVGAAMFARDITQIRVAERELEQIHVEVRASELQKASILDGVSANIALLDPQGNIVAVNAQWREFAKANGYANGEHGLGSNYVDVSNSSFGEEEAMGREAAEGVTKVLNGQLPMFTMEYPCHSATEQRWFRMRVTPLSLTANEGAVMLHTDITDIHKANEELHRWNTLLEDRVLERTTELLLVNEELEAETVKRKRLAQEVAARTNELMASINYASGIQRSLIPGREQFAMFKDMGLVYRPRDVVGGDFLWCHNTDEHFIVAVADCTGHGVPGAMLSMVGHDLLNNIIPRNEHWGPSRILNELDKGIKQLFLRNERLHISDGMDMAIAKLDKATLELRTSGAGLPVMVLRNGERTILPSSKVPLGGNHVVGCKLFNEFTYQLRPGDRLCMFTDGYADQFGGPLEKKLFRRVFLDLLSEHHTLPASEASHALATHFVEWKGKLDQVDDVLVLLLDV